jgi:DNA-binding XRE family transcriptional regulator
MIDPMSWEIALGMKIRQLREAAGMTQQQLAKRVPTQPSAISRIEDADYDGTLCRCCQRSPRRWTYDRLSILSPGNPR